MRPSKGDIRDGQWLKDVEEVFVVAFYLPPRIVGDFPTLLLHFVAFASLKKTSLILKSSTTQNFPLALPSA